jgi:hypothetical protein
MTWLEEYGIVYGIEEPTLTRLKTGFDEIRQVSGWENFKIPTYLWDWVGQTERDRALAFCEDFVWNTCGGTIANGATAEMHFAYCYTVAMLTEYWRDIDPKPQMADFYASMTNDWGIPSSALVAYSIDQEFGECLFDIAQPAGGTTECWFFYPDVSDTDIYIDQYTDYTVNFYSTAGNIYYHDAVSGTFVQHNDTDIGVQETWPEEALQEPQDPGGGEDPGTEIPQGIGPLVNGEHVLISGSATLRAFGIMEATVDLKVALGYGESLQVTVGDIPLFTGVVTEVRQNLAEGIYNHRIADPVTAGGGTVEYTSGDAISALQEAIEAHGGTFSTSMTTTETVFYPDDPQDAYQFFRAVSYAVGGVLQYGRDGVYRLVATPAAHGLNDSQVIADDRPTIEERTSDYANHVQATIDERWMATATALETESYSIGSQSYSATRLGEQIQSETISLGGESLEITYSYDVNGYMTRKEHSEEGSGLGAAKKTSLTEWSSISADGNQYNVDELHEEFTYCQLYDNSTGTFYNSWVPTSKTTREWQVDLDGMAYLEEEIWGTEPLFAGNINVSSDLYPALGSLIRLHKYRGGAVVNPAAGPLEGRGIFKKYNYVHNGFEDNGGVPTGTVGYVYVGTETRSVNPPALEMCAAEEENEVHIIAGAKDPDAITALGQHKYETQAVALNTSTGMQNFAKGVLYEKSRIRKANVSTAMGGMLPLDTVGWRDLVWTVQSVTVNLDGANDDLEITTQSTQNRLAGALSKEPVTWTEDVRNAINKRVGQFDNVSRGKVTGRVGKRRYTVQAEGKADPIEAKALNDDPVPVDATVLLARPTGKNQPWTLLNLSKEDKITITPDVEEIITPPEDPKVGITSFTADIIDPMPGEIVSLTWDYGIPDGYAYNRVIISDGAGNDLSVTDGEIKTAQVTYNPEDGTEFMPTATLVTTFGEDEVFSNVTNLENGPVKLTYLKIDMTVDPVYGETQLDTNVDITVIPVNEFADYTVVTFKIRPHEDSAYTNISATTQQISYNYDTLGVYIIELVTSYSNSRGFTKSETYEQEVFVVSVANDQKYSMSTSGGGDGNVTSLETVAVKDYCDGQMVLPSIVHGMDAAYQIEIRHKVNGAITPGPYLGDVNPHLSVATYTNACFGGLSLSLGFKIDISHVYDATNGWHYEAIGGGLYLWGKWHGATIKWGAEQKSFWPVHLLYPENEVTILGPTNPLVPPILGIGFTLYPKYDETLTATIDKDLYLTTNFTNEPVHLPSIASYTTNRICIDDWGYGYSAVGASASAGDKTIETHVWEMAVNGSVFIPWLMDRTLL